MSDTVLFVDDDPSILAAIARQFHRAFTIQTAEGGQAGLDAVRTSGPFAVVVADMRMPGVDGISLLKEVRTISPKTIRIMLTGNADQRTAMDAVNHGAIFRFLNKPCQSDVLAQALRDAITQYRIGVAEAELLEKTLVGAVRMLTEILTATDPDAFGRSLKLRQLASAVATALGMENRWQIEMAAMLANVGRVAVPSKVKGGGPPASPSGEGDRTALAHAAQTGANLLRMIPRLDPVATIVLYQGKSYSGSGFPQDAVAGEEIPVASRLLRILDDMLTLEEDGKTRSTALRIMTSRYGWYDPELLRAVHQHLLPPLPEVAPTPVSAHVPRSEPGPAGPHGHAKITKGICDLKAGDVLVEAAQAYDGTFLLTAGQVMTGETIESLRQWDKTRGVREPLVVAAR